MEAIGATAKYWLVDHPTITNFEWKRGITMAASSSFLIRSLISYFLMIPLLLYYHSHFQTPSLPLGLISTVYNLISFTLSLLMAVGSSLSTLSQMRTHPHGIFCFPSNTTPSRGPIFFWGYVFYLSKTLEFTDTFFIILLNRSSSTNRRLSFLHVFHHSMVLIMSFSWINTPISMFPLGVILNSTVHTLMYSYYLMCSIGIRPSWKKMVTNIQIFQFVFGFSMAGIAQYSHMVIHPCPGWAGPTYVWCFNVLFVAYLLYLFVDFYFKNYNKNKIQAQEHHKKKKPL